jgi:hypothetical protein
MAIAYPFTARYFVRFRHSDTALTPTFNYFKRADTLVGVTSPPILEVGGGTYYFDYSFTTSAAPDLVFEIDGGSSIPTEEVRYISDTISIKDHFIDQPTSQVVSDVWTDAVVYAAGTKGKRVADVGVTGDAYNAGTLFGAIVNAIEMIRGDGHGNTAGNSVKQAYDRIGTPVGLTISADLQTIDSHITTSTGDTGTAITAAVVSIKGGDGRDLTQIYNFSSHFDGQIDLVQAMVARCLGMLHENAVLDKCIYDISTNKLSSARLRMYDSSTNAQAAKALGDGTTYTTGMIGQHSIVAEYSGSNMSNYMVVRELPL